MLCGLLLQEVLGPDCKRHALRLPKRMCFSDKGWLRGQEIWHNAAAHFPAGAVSLCSSLRYIILMGLAGTLQFTYCCLSVTTGATSLAKGRLYSDKCAQTDIDIPHEARRLNYSQLTNSPTADFSLVHRECMSPSPDYCWIMILR